MDEKLYETACKARERAYAPYSTFKVGAAVKTTSGNIYSGCNIENASYSLTICAERTAIFQAIANGETEFAELVVVGDTEQPIRPCGACRQVMAEFFTADTKIYLTNLQKEMKETSLQQLLPDHFTL